MTGKVRDCCIGFAIKVWLTFVLVFIALTSSRACGQDAPSTKNVESVACAITPRKSFTVYTLDFFAVRYSDGTPEWKTRNKEPLDTSSSDDELWDECKAFMYDLLSRQIDERIAQGKAAVAKAKEEHFFLDAKKLAKK